MAGSKNTLFDDSINLKGKEFDEVCTLIANVTDARGILHKADDTGRKWARCFSFAPGEYTEEQLLDVAMSDYGPGEYPVQFKSPNENNKNVIRWQQHFAVQSRRSGAPKAEPVPAPAPATSNDAIVLALENQARILEKLSEIISRPLPTPPEQKTTADFLKEIAGFKELFSDNRSGALEQFTDFMTLRKLISEDLDGGEADPLTTAIKTLMPAITKGAEALQEKEAAAPPAPTRPARAEPPVQEPHKPEQPEAAKPEPLTDDEIKANIDQVNEAQTGYAFQYFAERYLPAAMQLAKTNQDPAQTATWLARLIGDNVLTVNLIGIVLSQNDMVERFAKFNGEVMNYAAWLDDVGDWLAHALWPDANPEPGRANATKSATIDAIDEGGDITAADAGGQQPLEEPTASGEPIPDAENTDLPTTGDSNDA